MSGKTVNEVDIWSGIISADDEYMTVPEANAVLRWAFNENAKSRMEELANRNGQGTLSEAEREELEAYVNVGQVIGILQAKAHLALKNAGEKDSE